MDILIVLEHKNNTIHRMSWEAVAAGQSLAKDLGLTTSILVLGFNVEKIVEEASKKNVGEIVVAKHSLLQDYSADGYAKVLQQVIESESPTYVIMGHTYMVRDFLPRISASLRKPFLGDLISYRIENGAPIWTKQMFQGKLVADVSLVGDAPYLLTFQSAAFQSDAAIEGSGANVRHITIDLEDSMIRTKSEKPFQEAVADVDLSAADVIVAVGRGVGKEENLDMMKELAKALGAQIAASRPVVDAEWLPSYHQVGSSGQTVAPKLYLALGISGAIQHVVGMKGSKNIVVINKDQDAPLFELADYGIVGDIMEIVPRLTESVKAAKE